MRDEKNKLLDDLTGLATGLGIAAQGVREEVEQRAGAHLDPLGARVLELEVLPLLEHAERALEPDRGPEQFAVGPSPAEHIPAALDAQGRAQTFI